MPPYLPFVLILLVGLARLPITNNVPSSLQPGITIPRIPRQLPPGPPPINITLTRPANITLQSTPHFQNGTMVLAAQNQNHWWLVDYWNSWSWYGKFTAVANQVQGLGPGDDVLILPLNQAFGSTLNLEWFQFDIDFHGSNVGTGNGWWGNVGWWIWNIDAPSPFGCLFGLPSQNYHHTPIGLAYAVGHTYEYWGWIVNGNFRFEVWDDSSGGYWQQDFSVPGTSPVSDPYCFSPASAVEGYTTPSIVSSVPYYQFNLPDSALPLFPTPKADLAFQADSQCLKQIWVVRPPVGCGR